MNFVLSSLGTGKNFDRESHQAMVDGHLTEVRKLIQSGSDLGGIRESLQGLIAPSLFALQSECGGNDVMTQLIAAEWERRAREKGKSLS